MLVRELVEVRARRDVPRSNIKLIERFENERIGWVTEKRTDPVRLMLALHQFRALQRTQEGYDIKCFSSCRSKCGSTSMLAKIVSETLAFT